jgi:hypothetical protein
MQIRQLSVHYDLEADRLLLRVRSADDRVFGDLVDAAADRAVVAAAVVAGAARRCRAGAGPGLAASRAHAGGGFGAGPGRTRTRELMAAAPRQADWGIAIDPVTPEAAAPRVLN